MSKQSGFFKYPADKLGTTSLVAPNANTGQKGDLFKLLDLSIPDSEAEIVTVSIRSEYSTNQATVSQTLSGPFPISGASNAAPIVITTPTPHGLVSTQSVSLNGVGGNVAANGAWTITVLSPFTFSLNGSDGTLSGVYTSDGSYQASSAGGTGSGAANIGSPLVAILQWGIGGGQNQVEFDVPPPKVVGLLTPTALPTSQPVSNIGNGVQVAVGASHISLYVRNDANLSPLVSPGVSQIGNSLTPAKVIAFISPGQMNDGTRLERTIFIAEAISSLAVAASVTLTVPPFARSIRVQRAPSGTPVGLVFQNNVGNPYRNVDLGPNDEGPILIDPVCQNIVVVNAGAVALPRCSAVFDVKP